MKNRRTFVKESLLASMGVMIFPSCMEKGSSVPPIGLQLYTLRDAMKEDPVSTLKKVAKIGYKELESAGYSNGRVYGFSGKEFNSLVQDLGLKHISGHMGYQAFEDFERTLEFMVDAGQKYAVLPWLNQEQKSSLDQYKKHAELLNRAAEKAKTAEIRVCYHNHDFEFTELEGDLPINILLKEVDKDLVDFEFDLYWISKAGHDPVEFIRRFKNRVPLWHVKDMSDTKERTFTEVGNGVIDFESIFQNAEVSGMKHFFVEQDASNNPMKSVEISFRNLTRDILES